MRLWRDTGNAVQEACRAQKIIDGFRLGLIWPILMRASGYDPYTGAPLELRDDAE